MGKDEGTDSAGQSAPVLGTPSAGRFDIDHTVRRMRGYNLTDSDLESIDLTGYGVTLFSAVAAACLGFWLDVKKDIVLMESMSIEASQLEQFLDTYVFWIGLMSLGVAAYLWWRKRSTISRIKKESFSVESRATK